MTQPGLPGWQSVEVGWYHGEAVWEGSRMGGEVGVEGGTKISEPSLKVVVEEGRQLTRMSSSASTL